MDAHFESVLSGLGQNQSRSRPAFLQCDKFTGKRAGYVFKNGVNGVGYYLDHPPVQPVAGDIGDFEEHSSKRARLDNASQEYSARGGDNAHASSSSSSSSAAADSMDALLKQSDDVEALDEARLKHLILVLDKKVTSNQLMRAKYPSQPEKFMASEIDLHACIEELYSLAAYPELYRTFVEAGGMKYILGMVTHDNADISLASVGFLQELLDPDMILAPENIVEEQEEGNEEAGPDGARVNIAMCIVEAFLEGHGLELLVQNLARLDDTGNEEDAQGVHNTMAVLENLIEIRPGSVPTLVCEKTHILKFLILRLKNRTFDANKLYCSEILSILLQTLDGSNQRRLCRLHGIDGLETLLQSLHAVRKAEAQGNDEQECIQNMFLCLSSVLDVPSHQQQFRESQGLELLLRCMAERQYAAVGAIKALKFALAAQESGLHLIDIGGLKFIFPVLMGHSIWKPGKSAGSARAEESAAAAEKRNKKKATEEKLACEQSCIAVLAQLCLSCTAAPGSVVGAGAATGPAPGPAPGPMREADTGEANAVAARQQKVSVCAARLLAKFTENDCEKTERCAELYAKYASRCVQTEGRLAQLRLQLLADEDEESLEELDDADYYYLQRCNGGLTQLQELSFVLMWICYHSQSAGVGGSSCFEAVRTKLSSDRLSMGHVLDTLREAVAHTSVDEVDAALSADQNMDSDDEEAGAGPFSEDVRIDNLETRDLLLRKRGVMLNYCAFFARRLEE